MNYHEQERRVSALMDGELPATESGSVFQHLAECAECRMFYHRLLALSKTLDRGMELPRGDGRTGSVEQSLWSGAHQDGWWKQRISMRVPAFALTLLLIAAGAFISFMELSRGTQSETVYVTKLPAVVISAEGGTQ